LTDSAPEGWIVNIEEVDGLVEPGRPRLVTAEDIAEVWLKST
jgi:hypothetical protein